MERGPTTGGNGRAGRIKNGSEKNSKKDWIEETISSGAKWKSRNWIEMRYSSLCVSYHFVKRREDCST